MYVVGGHGYVGSRVVDFAVGQGAEIDVVSRHGDQRRGIPSLAWPEFLARIESSGRDAATIVWLLDGAKHDEFGRLRELVAVANERDYVAAVSTCTVYGDQQGRMCDENTPTQIATKNAELKAACEAALTAAPVATGILRFGALYGVDDRKERRDRIEKWVTEASTRGTVTVPDPSHWRGWLHRDQGARALYFSAVRRAVGIFNVATSNFRFADAADFAAIPFGAKVNSDGKDDPMDYKVDSARARAAGILDEKPGEQLAEAVAAFADTAGGSATEERGSSTSGDPHGL